MQNWKWKLWILQIDIEKQMEWGSVVGQRQRRHWRWRSRFQTILITKGFFFTTASPRLRLTQENNLSDLIFDVTYKLLYNRFRLRLKTYRFTKTKYTSIPATCLLENGAKCDKKTVNVASLEGQPCQIQQLITDNDTATASNIATTQRGSTHARATQKLQI